MAIVRGEVDVAVVMRSRGRELAGEGGDVGGRERQINVWLDPAMLEKYSIPAVLVERALRTQNLELPSGRVEQGGKQLTLRTLGRVDSVQELGELVVARRGSYAVRLSDLGRVEDGMAEAQPVRQGHAAQMMRPQMADIDVGRGIDVSGISHIINFDIPEFCDDYVHRVGRTGRMGREGVAYTLVTPEEGPELTRIEMRINRLLERVELDGFQATSTAPKVPLVAPGADAAKADDAKADGESAGEAEAVKKRPPPPGRRVRRHRRAL